LITFIQASYSNIRRIYKGGTHRTSGSKNTTSGTSPKYPLSISSSELIPRPLSISRKETTYVISLSTLIANTVGLIFMTPRKAVFNISIMFRNAKKLKDWPTY